MLRIGLLGCGNIAGIIASRCAGLAEIVACHDQEPAQMQAYAAHTAAKACPDMDSLLRQDYNILVEAASIEAVRDHLQEALTAGKDVVVLSVGALADREFLRDVRAQARRAGRRIHVPSGAIFGLDNLKVARICGLERLLLKTTKHPRSLGLAELESPRLLFRGSAAQAVRAFPKNINVSAALGLATDIEPAVELWADPAAISNRHEILAEGPFGTLSLCAENLPSPENPATSYLAALSVLTLLQSLEDPVRVGT